ncbi:MAG: SLBB domain-containing protein [Steroidobacteraceae bacterium]
MSKSIALHQWSMARILGAGILATLCFVASRVDAQSSSQGTAARAQSAAMPEQRRVSQLGAGDQVSIQVYSQPDMDKTTYVGDDGTIDISLAGPVKVAGLSPQEASQRVERALVEGQFLVNPQVTITVVQPVSQRVSVLGEVRTPGRYPITPSTTIFDLLAQAGGVTENAGNAIYIERTGSDGKSSRIRVDRDAAAMQTLHSGDSVSVPAADQFYIYGEVTSPSKYRIEAGMTVIQAIARAGGITPRGSDRRVDIKRLGKDGQYVVLHAKAGDLVEPNDVIHVKESIF